MTELEKLGFVLEDGIYKHTRAPIRAIVTHGGSRVRFIYDLGQDILSSLIVDVDNTKHELLMGLTDMKKILEKLNHG